MARRYDNQHTTPPLTEAEWVERFQELVPLPHGGKDQHDWMALFVKYIRSTQTECPSLRAYLDGNGISYAAIQTRGGATFWNRARKAIQQKALVKAMDKSVDIVSKKYEQEIRVTSKLVSLIERSADRLIKAGEPLPDGTVPPINPFEASAIKTLAESVRMLAETNMKLLGDLKGDGTQVGVQVNLHADMMAAVKKRNEELGVVE